MPLMAIAVWVNAQEQGLFTDSRDGETYKTVTIGDQEWMVDNARYNVPGSFCLNNNDKYCVLGRYYNFPQALEACPDGWHIPILPEVVCVLENGKCVSIDGRNSLVSNMIGKGIEEKLGTHLKSSKTWKPSETPVGKDEFNFSVIPAGYYINGEFGDQGGGAYFWIRNKDRGPIQFGTPEIHVFTQPAEESSAYYFYFYNDSEELGVNVANLEQNYYSVRCVRPSSAKMNAIETME